MNKQQSHSWFWLVQLLAWLFVGLVNFSTQYISGSFRPGVVLLNLVGVSVGGLLVTSLYRIYTQRKTLNFKLSPGRFMMMLFSASFLQAILWLMFILVISIPFLTAYHIKIFHLLFNLFPLMGMATVWTLCYLGYHLIRRYHHSEVEKWRMEAEVQKAQLGALKAQINPHFMFNALNNIRAQILEDPALARVTLTKFSEIFRYTLQHSDSRTVHIETELEILNQYLELLKLQYENRLEYSINADSSVMQEKIPPMMLQLLVENAIKHGISISETGGKIIVDINLCDSKLLIAVRNTGSLNKKNMLEDSLGIGLQNIKERLKLIYGDLATLDISEHAPFVHVEISICNHD